MVTSRRSPVDGHQAGSRLAGLAHQVRCGIVILGTVRLLCYYVLQMISSLFACRTGIGGREMTERLSLESKPHDAAAMLLHWKYLSHLDFTRPE